MRVFKNTSPHALHLTLERADGKTETITTTKGHPFHIPGRGFVFAGELRIGDLVSSGGQVAQSALLLTSSKENDASGVLRVKALSLEDRATAVYNFEVAETHTYFVGRSRAWVHNISVARPTFPNTLPARLSEEIATASPLKLPSPAATGIETLTIYADSSGALSIGKLPPAIGKEAIPLGYEARTVWDAIHATQGVYPGSVIPRSFELTLESGEKVWVHGNATEHLVELANRTAANYMPETVRQATQLYLSELQGALNEATRSGIKYGELITVGRWELKFAPPREAGQLPALIHAQPK